MYPDPIKKLIERFSQFPTIGPKTATRFVFYLLKKDTGEINELVQEIVDLKKYLGVCSFCFNSFQKKNDESLCAICSHPGRKKEVLCIVEKETDLAVIENASFYKGLYFILGGLISEFKKSRLENLRTEQLVERIANPEKFGQKPCKEIIIAINPTVEGDTTALYLERMLKETKKDFKITRLARGLPMGGELEYADESTLSDAFQGRR